MVWFIPLEPTFGTDLQYTHKLGGVYSLRYLLNGLTILALGKTGEG